MSGVTWDDGEVPRSILYDDVYFASQDGLAESRAVFLVGCGLPKAWAGRRRFVVAELGFGTGLNVAALLDLWGRARPAAAHLHIFSIEAHPLSAAEAIRALARWPELGDIAGLLTSRWPGRARGFHRVDLPEFAATLDVAVMTAAEALVAWSGPADAWFLDGFSPARNPDMWRGDLLDVVGRRSAPGARVASFTVAGQVRRDLVTAGFTVERAPGFGAKRQRLEARRAGRSEGDRPPRRVAIVGAGIAGASLSKAFSDGGAEVTVLDAVAPGAGASGGTAALAAPRLDAGLGPAAELFAQAMRRAIALYDGIPGAVIARGALQLEMDLKDARRFAAIAACSLFEAGAMRRLTSAETSERLGETVAAGLLIEGAVVVEPGRLLAGWLQAVARARIDSVLPVPGGGWRLLDGAGQLVAQVDIVCLAAGMDCARLSPGLPLAPVRGQASLAHGAAWPLTTLFGGYVIPTPCGLMFGATHDRGDESDQVRASDNDRNLWLLDTALPGLASRLASAPLHARAAIRATTSDFLPLAGPVPGSDPGLMVLSGLGSRGFALAPLLAEHVAALALGEPSPLPAAVAGLVDPARFARRARRRGVETKARGAGEVL